MIIVKLSGGLGNQMFQYAFGKNLAQKNKTSLILDKNYYRGKSDRKFKLDRLKVSYSPLSGSFLVRLLRKLLKPKKIKDEMSYDASLKELAGNIEIDGWWECPEYFMEIVDELKNEFTFKFPSQHFLEAATKVKPGSISVHVRRGDYLVPHGKYLNGFEYYDKAVRKIIETQKIHEPQITIFSDDKEWCKKELKTLGGAETGVFDAPGLDDVEEMQLMSLYNHNIISNSTFSWWAAQLNRNPNKMVVMPSNWYTDTKLNKNYVEEIHVDNWITI
jgi:hypothetical protein